MFLILVACFATALGAGFWFDNAIAHSVYQYWWVWLVLGYIVFCWQLPKTSHRSINRMLIATVSAAILLLVIWYFDDVMTIYVTGIVYLTAWGVGCYSTSSRDGQFSTLNRPVTVLVTIALIVLPISINRILVKLPNLSAGTTIALQESESSKPDLDAIFYNRINDKFEIEVYLGSQIYFQQPHETPKLKIETTIPKVVVRLLSVSYQHRFAYLDLPLFELTEDDLLRLELTSDGVSVEIVRDRIFLLLSGFQVNEPVWLKLPHMESHEINLANQGLIVFFRVLIWLVICFGIAIWLPKPARGGLR